MSSSPTFDEFGSSAEAEWRSAAEQVLKGRSVEEVLESGTWEGVRRRPIYHESDRPGDREVGAMVPRRAWRTCQELAVVDPGEFNAAAMELLARGQELMGVRLGGRGWRGLQVSDLDDLTRAFSGVLPNAVGYRFSGASGMAFLGIFEAWLTTVDARRSEIHGCLGLDPLGDMVWAGHPPGALKGGMDEVAACAAHNHRHLPLFRAANVGTVALHDAGASAVLELGAALAAGIWMVRALCDRGLSITQAVDQISFTMGVGSDFFMEIAKFRAVRFLWRRVVEKLGGGAGVSGMDLHARTGRYNKARSEPHTNLVRTTSEALSAVIGGVDSLHVGCFDEVGGSDSTFSRRLAVNVQMILREECGLGVADPAGGSYYVESLTEQVAERAWDQLREIESSGGYPEALGSGLIATRIEETHGARNEALTRRRAILVGVNRYVHGGAGGSESDLGSDLDLPDTNLGAPTVSSSFDFRDETLISRLVEQALAGGGLEELQEECGGQTSAAPPEVPPLHDRRLARDYEELAATVDHRRRGDADPPMLSIVRMGAAKTCLPKVEFVKDFFGVGGFSFVEVGVDDAPAVIRPDRVDGVMVVCAGPDVEAGRVRETIAILKEYGSPKAVLVAMKPDRDEELWRNAGVDDFVFRGCNHHEMNRKVLTVFGEEPVEWGMAR